MKLADELKLPLVTVIDTSGAALSREAEEGGLAGEIARSLQDLVLLDAPTVCLLLGEGAGGGALALLPADRVVCAQHAWLSPLPPEGASAIIHRTTERAPEMAEAQGVRSLDLLRAGIVDRVVAEHPDAADEPAAYLERLARVLELELTAPAPPRPPHPPRRPPRPLPPPRLHPLTPPPPRPARRRVDHAARDQRCSAAAAAATPLSRSACFGRAVGRARRLASASLRRSRARSPPIVLSTVCPPALDRGIATVLVAWMANCARHGRCPRRLLSTAGRL